MLFSVELEHLWLCESARLFGSVVAGSYGAVIGLSILVLSQEILLKVLNLACYFLLHYFFFKKKKILWQNVLY